MIIYETERLIVREWETKDYKDLYEYASLDEVTKYLSWPTYTDIEQAKVRIEDLKNKYDEKTSTPDYAIELKSENKVIGSIGIVDYSPKAGGIIEIGYVLNPSYQGKGYMTETLKGMFVYIKQNQLAKRIVLRHDIENVKSGNVMRRAGMTFEGINRKAGNKNNTHTRYDIAQYSILDEEIEI